MSRGEGGADVDPTGRPTAWPGIFDCFVASVERHRTASYFAAGRR